MPPMTQLELARRSGVPAQTISAYEALDQEPGLWSAMRLAIALGVRVEVLFEHHAHLATLEVSRRVLEDLSTGPSRHQECGGVPRVPCPWHDPGT